jgi:hypothetical protein
MRIASTIVLLALAPVFSARAEDTASYLPKTLHVAMVQNFEFKCSELKHPDKIVEDKAECDRVTRIIVQGYIDKTLYMLSCDEAYTDNGKQLSVCAPVHANYDYQVELYSTAISLWGLGESFPNGPTKMYPNRQFELPIKYPYGIAKER